MLTKLEVSRKIFVYVPNIKFYGNLSSEDGADTRRQRSKQTDILDEASRRFSIFVRTLLKTHHFSHAVCLCSLQFLQIVFIYSISRLIFLV
jgi:hypothetical protein